MARNRIFYGLFLLAAVVFHSFYTGWFSFFLLLFSVLLPVFSLLVSLPAMLRAAYTPQLPLRCFCGQDAQFALQPSSASRLPVSCCRLHLLGCDAVGGTFDMLFELAKELHAEVGASRAAVAAGYAAHDRQIGQTGVTVRPKLYIACGISGQIQHIAGMQDSGIIISINNDENAPINTIADYVINGTVEEVIPKMIKYYKQNSK